MDLTKSSTPSRNVKWKGKSLASCSRKELIDCVLELMKQLSITNALLKQGPAEEKEGGNVQ